MSDNITRFPVRPKTRKLLSVVNPSACQHLRAEVCEKLAEITCADCGVKLNPIAFLMSIARQLTTWEYEAQQIAKVRAEYADRKRCRCTKCGELTEIRPVGVAELARIKGSKA